MIRNEVVIGLPRNIALSLALSAFRLMDFVRLHPNQTSSPP